jgi:chromosome partitioning protein
MNGKVITIASLKGGSGKSTMACCLAVHWRLKKYDAVLIDADPQRSVARLAEREMKLGGVPVIEKADKNALRSVSSDATKHEVTIIDTPGFDSDVTIAALKIADLVLIPVKASPMDVDRMLDTVSTLLTSEQDWTPNFFCILTQTTRSSVISRHIRSELEESRFPVFTNELPNRVAYAEAGLFGATPTLIAPKSAAAKDIAAVAAETEKALARERAASA